MTIDLLSENPITPLQEIELPGVDSSDVTILFKRLDLIHPQISGNKWYKLKYNLLFARENGYDTLLSFGGAYSNHIHALAAAGKLFGFKTIGVIRGEVHQPLNPTLQSASKNGMTLHYLDRNSYRSKNTDEIIESLKKIFGKFYPIPEGGSNALAVKGCSEIVKSIDSNFDYICVPCGTGGTLAGLICGLNNSKKIIGFPVLKDGQFLHKDISELVYNFSGQYFSNWKLQTEYHFEGYAKVNSSLTQFIFEFEKLNQIEIEPIYTGKMLFGIADLIRKKFFETNSVIAAIHTGGLQGLKGMKMRYPSLFEIYNPVRG